jgi:5-hydroxyisourate hydrolase
MSSLSSHILDISRGKPAAGVVVRLLRLEGEAYQELGRGTTNDNGRIAAFSDQPLPAGRYQLIAELGDWFAARDLQSLYPCACIDFVLGEDDEHYHLPFTIAPGGWSTYRGS